MPVIKRTIFNKVVLVMILLVALSTSLSLIISIQSQSSSIEKSLTEESLILSNVAAKSIETGYVIEQWPFETLKEISDLDQVVFLWAVNLKGEIFLADDSEMWGVTIDDPDLGSKSIVIKDSIYPKTQERIKLIIQPIFTGSQGSLFLGMSLKPIEAARDSMIMASFVYFFIIISFAVFLSFRFAKSLTNPIKVLTKGAEEIGSGNLSYRLNLKTRDEIEEVANAFNKMAKDLEQSKAALERSKQTLEIKVKERTKDLQERIEELERFHRLTVGRELKMIELKKAIKRNKKELKIYRNI